MDYGRINVLRMQKHSVLQRKFNLQAFVIERGERKNCREKDELLNNQVLRKPVLGGKQEVTAHLE